MKWNRFFKAIHPVSDSTRKWPHACLILTWVLLPLAMSLWQGKKKPDTSGFWQRERALFWNDVSRTMLAKLRMLGCKFEPLEGLNYVAFIQWVLTDVLWCAKVMLVLMMQKWVKLPHWSRMQLPDRGGRPTCGGAWEVSCSSRGREGPTPTGWEGNLHVGHRGSMACWALGWKQSPCSVHSQPPVNTGWIAE